MVVLVAFAATLVVVSGASVSSGSATVVDVVVELLVATVAAVADTGLAVDGAPAGALTDTILPSSDVVAAAAAIAADARGDGAFGPIEVVGASFIVVDGPQWPVVD